MTPEARLAAAAEILDSLDLTRLVDPQLKVWARKNRFAGSGDRRAIADRIYTVLRRMRSSTVAGGEGSGRALVLGSLVSEDGLPVEAIAKLCDGKYGLSVLEDRERENLANEPQFRTEAERLDWPDWLFEQAQSAFGNTVAIELDALRQRAPLDLRVNTIHTSRGEVTAMLEAEGIAAFPVEIAETALRLTAATPILNTEAYRMGMIEPQDAASQAVAAFSQVQSDHRVLDFCAGAGGKTLALAAEMKGKGVLIAHDVNPKRMDEIPQRAERAGVTIIKRAALSALSPGSFDSVLVDAPCSGSGSWRRDPLGKWRLTPERLEQLREAQRDALSSASRFVKPGGLLTYATCSILPTENHEQVAWFASTNSAYTLEDTLNLWPARDECDGFFAARFRRQGA